MSPLAVVLAYLAVVIIVVRGPLAFAPEATVDRFKRWFFPSVARFRLMGVGMLVLIAAPLILTARMTPPAHPDVVWFEALGWLVAVGGASVIALPKPMCRLAEGIFVRAPTPVLRVLGVANIAFGLFLAWVAVAVL